MSKMITGAKGVVRKHPLEVQMQIRRLEDNKGKEDNEDSKPEYQYVTNDALSEDIRAEFSAANYRGEKPSSRKLRDNMLSVMSEDAKDWYAEQQFNGFTPQAHHVVAETSMHDSAQKSRDILKECGIELDDPRNGIFLPTRKTKENGSPAEGSLHSSQSVLSDDLVYLHLKRAKDSAEKGNQEDMRERVLEALDNIKEDLYNELFPISKEQGENITVDMKDEEGNYSNTTKLLIGKFATLLNKRRESLSQ